MTPVEYLWRLDLRFSALDDVEARRVAVALEQDVAPEVPEFAIGSRIERSSKLQRLRTGEEPKGVPL
jgi:hypothetical protein